MKTAAVGNVLLSASTLAVAHNFAAVATKHSGPRVIGYSVKN
jgi:hypothetical protein